MKLPGTEIWEDADVEAALAFASNLVVSTVLIGRAIQERNPPGGPILRSDWSPTDVHYMLGDAAALAFATGRVRQGLGIAGSLLASIEGSPPRLTLMQTIFGATLGAIAGTADVQLFEDEVAIGLEGRRGYVTLDLSVHPLREQLRLSELIIPAAFASPSYLAEVAGLQVGQPTHDLERGLVSAFARLSPLTRFAQGWKDARHIDMPLLVARLVEYEGYVEALRADEGSWEAMEFRGPLIDWPLLATLVGLHRAAKFAPEQDVTVGPSTRFLHDLARTIAAESAQPDRDS